MRTLFKDHPLLWLLLLLTTLACLAAPAFAEKTALGGLAAETGIALGENAPESLAGVEENGLGVWPEAVEYSVAAKAATAPVEKFSQYIFKGGADHGKDAVFRGLGYDISHSEQLAKTWEAQAAEKFARGEYTLGKLDQYGQRINIGIELRGIGDAEGKTSYLKSGWMILENGDIRLNTPFSGFYK